MNTNKIRRQAFIGLVLVGGIGPVIAVPLRAEPLLTKSVLWEAGEGGYKLYRIPGLVVTKAGTVLAYCEARKFTGSDWDTIDLAMRRSTDGGKTFSPPQIMAHVTVPVTRSPVALAHKNGTPADVTYNNPVAIADRNGVVHFLFCIEYLRVFYSRSTDDGKTFSPPVEITSVLDQFRRDYDWKAVATGPGHGIQLANGRLLVPVWMGLGTSSNGHGPSEAATIYSDDHGKTWHRGEIAVRDTPEFRSPNETTAVQLADGRVMLNVRTAGNLRTIVVSRDGATGWSEPRLQQDLPDPVCFGSLARYSTRKSGGQNRLLFVNPDNLTRKDGKEQASKDRRNLTVRLSENEGASWTVKRVLEPEGSAYADLAVLRDGTILCLYEANGGARTLTLARFNLDWLNHAK